MKNSKLFLITLMLALASPATAKEPTRPGFEDWLCHYLPNGWLVCKVKPGNGPK